jgi:phosphoribosylanthranilate isomerase
MKIKICGLTNTQNIRELVSLKPDFLGFIFYRASPRYAGDKLDVSDLLNIPLSMPRVGVFVNSDPYEIHGMQWKFKLDYIQLHGDESPAFCEQITQSGAHVIKAFRITDHFDFSKLMDYVGVCRYFLFDASSSLYGGSGKQFDWAILKKYELGHPFFLSGGIGPGDATRILRLSHPSFIGLDINSRFETEPGIKDPERVKKFLRQVRKNKY